MDAVLPFDIGANVIRKAPGSRPVQVRSYITPGFDMVIGYPGYPAGWIIPHCDIGDFELSDEPAT